MIMYRRLVVLASIAIAKVSSINPVRMIEVVHELSVMVLKIKTIFFWGLLARMSLCTYNLHYGRSLTNKHLYGNHVLMGLIRFNKVIFTFPLLILKSKERVGYLGWKHVGFQPRKCNNNSATYTDFFNE